MASLDMGAVLLNRICDVIAEKNDVELWYSDSFYDVQECWSYAADGIISQMNRKELEQIMHWLILNANDNEVGNLFNDGFTYHLGTYLDTLYRGRIEFDRQQD